jgi:hypothetical protein
MQMQPEPRARQSAAVVVVFVVALLAHLAIGVPLLAAGLVAPLYAIVLFWIFWGVMLLLLLRLRTRRPLLTPLIPVATAAGLIGALSFGGEVLGWTP